AELVPSEAVQARVVGVQLGAEDGAALEIPSERVAGVAEIFGPGTKVFGGVGQLENARDDEGKVRGRIPARSQDRQLLIDEEVEMHATDFEPSSVVERDGTKVTDQSGRLPWVNA